MVLRVNPLKGQSVLGFGSRINSGVTLAAFVAITAGFVVNVFIRPVTTGRMYPSIGLTGGTEDRQGNSSRGALTKRRSENTI